MGRIISIANQKGGVGKTTTAVNLSASLAVAEKRTLLVDSDPQGNTSSGLGVVCDKLDATIYHSLIGKRAVEEVIRDTDLEYLDLIPANTDLIGAEIELVGAQGRESRLKDALKGVVDRYEFIIIDCPPSLGLLTINALTTSDSVLIPLQCEYYAMEGLGKLLNTIRLVKSSLNPHLDIEGVLLTMFDGRNNLSHQVAAEVREHFREKVYDTVIPRNVRLSECPSHGKPALLYDIKCKGAQCYLALAEEMLYD